MAVLVDTAEDQIRLTVGGLVVENITLRALVEKQAGEIKELRDEVFRLTKEKAQAE